MVVDLKNPRIEVSNLVALTLESVASLYGTVAVGNVSGIDLSDLDYGLRVSENITKRNGPLRAKYFSLTGQQEACFVRPYAFNYFDSHEELQPASRSQADLLLLTTYRSTVWEDGSVTIYHNNEEVQDVPFVNLRRGVWDMIAAYNKIRKELEDTQWRGIETEVTRSWKAKEPSLVILYGLPNSTATDPFQRIRENFAPATAAAKEFGARFCMDFSGHIFDRRTYIRRPDTAVTVL